MSEVNVKQVLTQARELISDPCRWTKDTPADDGIQPVSTFSPQASRFCAIGAVARALYESGHGESHSIGEGPFGCAVGILNKNTPGPGPVWCYNDEFSTTHEDVLAVFDKAIASIEE